MDVRRWRGKSQSPSDQPLLGSVLVIDPSFHVFIIALSLSLGTGPGRHTLTRSTFAQLLSSTSAYRLFSFFLGSSNKAVHQS